MDYNLDLLVEKLGKDTVDRLFAEYAMMLVAKGNMFDRITDYVNEKGSVDSKELERLIAGDSNGKNESFHT